MSVYKSSLSDMLALTRQDIKCCSLKVEKVSKITAQTKNTLSTQNWILHESFTNVTSAYQWNVKNFVILHTRTRVREVCVD